MKVKTQFLLFLTAALCCLPAAADVVNVAENGTPANSSPLWAPGKWDIHMLIDGNTASVFHMDTTPDAGANYTVDLGTNYTIQEIRIYPR